TRISKSLRIHPLSAAHAPRKVGDALSADAHAAIAEVHVPRVAGEQGEGRRRPVKGRLHADERMAGRQPGAAGIGWIAVHQTRQLLERGQPPPETTACAQAIAMNFSVEPRSNSRIYRYAKNG